MSSLPAGTVTFLFTDIEGSTRKWQNWPHKMKTALKRHDDILSKAIEDNGGWVFKTVGDAFCAAFHTAMDCINSVIAVQSAVTAEQWDLPERIKVRMSIHTGEAIERNNDYYGPALNRVARLEALAYGGQVLMS
ncbi:MAG: adenylate/guanylate cyclase domain-containing protein, partial [Spirochaetes bacterium]